jgi:hypothetical protein
MLMQVREVIGGATHVFMWLFYVYFWLAMGVGCMLQPTKPEHWETLQNDKQNSTHATQDRG